MKNFLKLSDEIRSECGWFLFTEKLFKPDFLAGELHESLICRRFEPVEKCLVEWGRLQVLQRRL